VVIKGTPEEIMNVIEDKHRGTLIVPEKRD